MPVNTNLPWLPSSEQFLRAIIAGSQIGQARERDNRPHFGGGGGGFRPLPVQEAPPQTPTDPHLVLNGSILSMSDQANGPVEALPAKPFTAGGRQFITDPISGTASPFVPPSRVEKVGNDLVNITTTPGQSSFTGNSPDQIKVDKLYEGGNPPSDHVNLSTIDTTGMSPEQIALARMFNPPRLSGSPSSISNYQANASSPQLPVSKEPVKITSQAEYDALPSGAIYINESGNRHRKP